MNLTEQLEELDCAEDFFDLLQVDYEPAVILNKRVPLLRLFHQALADFEAPELKDYQAALSKAYCLLKHGVRADFAASKCATCSSECG
ncbi:nitrogenase-stabilizing/protective protein NifW [Reinekea marinisedimentorum]|uniref:Nitrogenase-stabilizing/protective protein NifW n=1 Tax=Reinekea marinisedimentorum TaxID=230495 RepID=A0A4R3I101_9GAMM|nr:nitrogenase-stabilizing/protective protein NifW [Reinekea marinisedimentorum]TCS38864.1 nitrogenase-stabilizing/protective protein [Reinekea marinisedimentorum]